jgi:6-pyruvoyltetrahydropterin/6-carboxytetrahydropterin synthase
VKTTTVTKVYRDLPFAHRVHNHPGHCASIHGHNATVTLTFACSEPDPNTGFVIDLGELDEVKAYLKNLLDHTLLIAWNDPLKDSIIALSAEMKTGGLRIVGCRPTMEDLSEKIFKDIMSDVLVGRFCTDETGYRQVWLTSVTFTESSENSATYTPEAKK